MLLFKQFSVLYSLSRWTFSLEKKGTLEFASLAYVNVNCTIANYLWVLQGLGAVVGAISRNLSDLQDRQGSYLSIYDQPSLPLEVVFVYSMIHWLNFFLSLVPCKPPHPSNTQINKILMSSFTY